MATKAQVRDRAANDLGLLRLNQSLQAQDATRIESAYTEVYAQLKAEGMALWSSTADIPSAVVPYIVALMADNCLGTYGVSPERYQRIKLAAGDDGEIAKRAIRKYLSPDYPSMDNPTDY
jgi:hypothetical protein